MARGLSQAEFNRRVRYRLQKAAADIRKAGYNATYKRYITVANINGVRVDLSFNRQIASNGETAGISQMWVDSKRIDIWLKGGTLAELAIQHALAVKG